MTRAQISMAKSWYVTSGFKNARNYRRDLGLMSVHLRLRKLQISPSGKYPEGLILDPIKEAT